MTMAVMQVGDVCVRVDHWLVHVGMCVRFTAWLSAVVVPVVLVVEVRMFVREHLVRVLVVVTLAQHQGHTAGHHGRREQSGVEVRPECANGLPRSAGMPPAGCPEPVAGVTIVLFLAKGRRPLPPTPRGRYPDSETGIGPRPSGKCRFI